MVKKAPWNEEEEFVFIESHNNSIKNHFYSTIRRMISRVQKDEFPLELSKSL